MDKSPNKRHSSEPCSLKKRTKCMAVSLLTFQSQRHFGDRACCMGNWSLCYLEAALLPLVLDMLTCVQQWLTELGYAGDKPHLQYEGNRLVTWRVPPYVHNHNIIMKRTVASLPCLLTGCKSFFCRLVALWIRSSLFSLFSINSLMWSYGTLLLIHCGAQSTELTSSRTISSFQFPTLTEGL